jgi:hypothetical protein
VLDEHLDMQDTDPEQILKPAEKKQKYVPGSKSSSRSSTSRRGK